jgi:hypothetical protein
VNGALTSHMVGQDRPEHESGERAAARLGRRRREETASDRAHDAAGGIRLLVEGHPRSADEFATRGVEAAVRVTPAMVLNMIAAPRGSSGGSEPRAAMMISRVKIISLVG